MRYLYECPGCGEFESPVSGDTIDCRCGTPSRRVFAVSLHRSGAQNQGRWDPVVGQYVANHREFEYALRKGQEAQSEKNGMETKLAMVDARDHQALGELHGHDPAERKEMAQRTKFEKNK